MWNQRIGLKTTFDVFSMFEEASDVLGLLDICFVLLP